MKRLHDSWWHALESESKTYYAIRLQPATPGYDVMSTKLSRDVNKPTFQGN